jgi:hypothetical protein
MNYFKLKPGLNGGRRSALSVVPYWARRGDKYVATRPEAGLYSPAASSSEMK